MNCCDLISCKELVQEGLVRSIGISNFSIRDLKELYSTCIIEPVINQVELHPYLFQKELIIFCETKGIKVSAYSPLGQGASESCTLLKDKVVSS